MCIRIYISAFTTWFWQYRLETKAYIVHDIQNVIWLFLDGDDNFSKFSRNSQMDLLFPRYEMLCESTGNSVNKPHYSTGYFRLLIMRINDLYLILLTKVVNKDGYLPSERMKTSPRQGGRLGRGSTTVLYNYSITVFHIYIPYNLWLFPPIKKTIWKWDGPTDNTDGPIQLVLVESRVRD